MKLPISPAKVDTRGLGCLSSCRGSRQRADRSLACTQYVLMSPERVKAKPALLGGLSVPHVPRGMRLLVRQLPSSH